MDQQLKFSDGTMNPMVKTYIFYNLECVLSGVVTLEYCHHKDPGNIQEAVFLSLSFGDIFYWTNHRDGRDHGEASRHKMPFPVLVLDVQLVNTMDQIIRSI